MAVLRRGQGVHLDRDRRIRPKRNRSDLNTPSRLRIVAPTERLKEFEASVEFRDIGAILQLRIARVGLESVRADIEDEERIVGTLRQNRTERGFSLNDVETVEGLPSIGAQIQRSDGSCLGALSVSGPANRFKGDRFTGDIPYPLLGATNDVEFQLAYQEVIKD